MGKRRPFLTRGSGPAANDRESDRGNWFGRHSVKPAHREPGQSRHNHPHHHSARMTPHRTGSSVFADRTDDFGTAHMRRTTFTLALIVILCAACSRAPSNNPEAERRGSPGVHDTLRAKNPGYNGQGQFEPRGDGIAAALRESGIADLSPLKEMPLKELDLQNNPVSDLSPLEGLPLEALYLEGTQVSDLRPLKGMSLRVLYLSGTKVSDLSP